jgi:hypothetical protein
MSQTPKVVIDVAGNGEGFYLQLDGGEKTDITKAIHAVLVKEMLLNSPYGHGKIFSIGGLLFCMNIIPLLKAERHCSIPQSMVVELIIPALREYKAETAQKQAQADDLISNLWDFSMQGIETGGAA